MCRHHAGLPILDTTVRMHLKHVMLIMSSKFSQHDVTIIG